MIVHLYTGGGGGGAQSQFTPTRHFLSIVMYSNDSAFKKLDNGLIF